MGAACNCMDASALEQTPKVEPPCGAVGWSLSAEELPPDAVGSPSSAQLHLFSAQDNMIDNIPSVRALAECMELADAALSSGAAPMWTSLQMASSVILRASPGEGEPELCPLCLDDLAAEPLGVCVDVNGRRTCQHYFHLGCLQRVEGCHCPKCRKRFGGRAALPSICEDPDAWLRAASLTGEEGLTIREMCAVLQAMLRASPERIEVLVTGSWPRWAPDRDLLLAPSLQLVVEEIGPALLAPPAPVGAIEPAVLDTPSGCEHGNKGKAHATSTAAGTLCVCGEVHAVVGDRVQRARAWKSGDQDGGAGQLGTIVRCEREANRVLVRWDRGQNGAVHYHDWPREPEAHEVEHVPFGRVPDDLRELQARTGLSSVASEQLLSDLNFDLHAAVSCIPFLLPGRPSVSEEVAFRRRPVKLFDRVRVVPDPVLVQSWFDAMPPCQCGRPNCGGGLQWGINAERHLGREGHVVCEDPRDGCLRVEMVGRCNCLLWYPRLAIEPVNDRSEEVQPRFSVGSRVTCKVRGAWLTGTVDSTRWRQAGWGDRRTAPYSVRLDDGRLAFAPVDTDLVIRLLAGPDLSTL